MHYQRQQATKYYAALPFTEEIPEALLDANPEIKEVADISKVRHETTGSSTGQELTNDDTDSETTPPIITSESNTGKCCQITFV